MAGDMSGLGHARRIARSRRMRRWAVGAVGDVRMPTQSDPEAGLQALCGRW